MKRIWIESESLIGDYLMTTPAIRGLKMRHPDVPLCCVVNKDNAARPLMQNTPEIKGVYTKAEMQIMYSSGDPVYKGDAGLGFSTGLSHGCTMAEAFCKVWNVPFLGGWYKVDVPEQYRDFPKVPAQFVVLARHSRSCTSNDPMIRRANKCLANDFWFDLSTWLLEQNYLPVFVGSAEDERDPAYEKVPSTSQKVYGEHIMNVAGLLQRAICTVSVDTGIRHMAAAVGGNLLTLNHAIPLHLIRCEPQHSNQHIREVQVDIHDSPGTLEIIKPELSELLKDARRRNTPS